MPISTGPKESRFKDALWYAAATGAVLGFGAPTAQAQIVYQDIDPDAEVQNTGQTKPFNHDPFPIDFDGDGNAELLLVEETGGRSIHACWDEGFITGTTDEDRVTSAIGNRFSGPFSDFNYFLPVSAGSTISSDVVTLSSFGNANCFYGVFLTRLNDDPNGFVGIGDTYLGLSFQLGEGTTHYAWVRVEVPETGLLIVKDYAFNATPDTPINAGDTGGTTANDDGGALGGALARAEAYPNPFASELRYTLEVAAAQDVEVAVYDVLGRRVATLHEGALAAGSQHAFVLSGSGLPNGLYLVEAKGERFSQTTRVTLAR